MPIVYHEYDKNNKYLRKALYDCYDSKCFYCNDMISQKNMEVDHILATNRKKSDDEDFNNYIDELNKNGFKLNSIENYVPACPKCNASKNNKNYLTRNFRHFHQNALDNSSKILRTITKLKKKKNFSFPDFDPDYDYWSRIDFSNQRDLSFALSGYSLNENDVLCCPKFAQVNEVLEKLKYVNYVCVKGQSGCGKSITIFQACYELFKSGWNVYIFQCSKFDECYLPNVADNTVVIIDDSQLLQSSDICKFKSLTSSKKKIVFGFTGNDFEVSDEDIVINNKKSVNTLFNYYKSHEFEITKLLHAIDKEIGFHSSSLSLSRRLDEAKKQQTPYMFNFVIRGGWDSMNSRLNVIENHNDCLALLYFISLLQLFHLDAPVNKDELMGIIHIYDENLEIYDDDIKFLIKQKLLFDDELKIIHQMCAVRIVEKYTKTIEKQHPNKLQKIIKVLASNGFGKGFLVIFECGYSMNIHHYFFDSAFVEEVFDLEKHNYNNEEKGYLLYFLGRYSSWFNTNDLVVKTKKYKRIFQEWVSNLSDINVVYYGNFLNDLINQKSDIYDLFVDGLNYCEIVKSFSKSTIENMYMWSYFLSRILYENENLKDFISGICDTLNQFKSKINEKNIEYFIAVLSRLHFYNVSFCDDYLNSIIDILTLKCASDISYYLSLFSDFELNAFIGYYGFDYYEPSESNKKNSILLLNMVEPSIVANYVNDSKPSEWKSAYEYFIILDYYYSEEQVRLFLNSLDINKNIYCDEIIRESQDDIYIFLKLIYFKNKEEAEKFLLSKIDLINELSIRIVALLPEVAIKMYDQGIGIPFEDWYSSLITIDAITKLLSIDKDKTIDLLRSSNTNVINFFNFNNLDLEDDEYLKFIQYLDLNHPSILKEFTQSIDTNKLLEQNYDFYNSDYINVDEMKNRAKAIVQIYKKYK